MQVHRESLCCFTSEWLAELNHMDFDGYQGADWKQRKDQVCVKVKAANWEIFVRPERYRHEITYGPPRFGVEV